MRRATVLALCLASQAEGFVPSLARGPTNELCSYRKPATCIRMAQDDDFSARSDRRSMLVRAAVLGAVPLAAASPAAAQFGDFKMPDPSSLLGDPRGERPAGLGPLAVKRSADGFVERGFLSPCNSDNCVSTSDDVYSKRFLPPWTYNDEGASDKTPEEAMEDLVTVIKKTKGAKIIKQNDFYILAEFERELGFVDDVEFLIKTETEERGGGGTVEYRSGARKSKKSDHRSRIKALRVELQKKGWKSVGYR